MANKRFHTGAALFFVAFLLFILHAIGWLRPVESLAMFLFDPIAQKMYAIGSGLGNITGRFFVASDDRDAREENRLLREALEQTKFQNAQLRILAEENEDLKQQLRFAPPEAFEKVSVRVISKDYFLPHTFLIDAGTEDGLKVGLGVFAHEGIFVGKITSIDARHAVVTLLVDTNSRSAASVLSEEAVSNGVTRGEHNLNIRMEFLPKGVVIKTGDAVVTSGLEENIPSGFIIGTVAEVLDEPEALFQSARVNPAVDFSEIKFLSVFKPI